VPDFEHELADLLNHDGSLLDTAVDVDSLPDQVASKAIKLARSGYAAKAVRCLSAARVADPSRPEVQAEMDAKHPHALPPDIPDDIRATAAQANIPAPTARQVARALSSFSLGTAPGPSGLSVQHIKDLATVPGSTLTTEIAALCHHLMCGTAPRDVIEHFAGAKLVALVKKDGSLRPIAVGDTLRRIAARLLATSHKSRFRSVLEAAHQLGVGTPSAIDGICHTMRRVAADARLKIDLSNAFNRVDRSAMFRAIAHYCPGLLPYAISIYGGRPRLFLGTHTILSLMGTQQGDPLAPVIFALVLAYCMRDFTGGNDLALEAWYLDDGSAAGTLAALRAWFDHLVKEGPQYGLFVNHAKCEIISDLPPAVTTEAFPEIPVANHRTLDDWDLLGTAMGTNAASSVDTFVDRSIKKMLLIASLPDPHVAFTLLRFCSAGALVNHLMRTFGPHPAFERFDTSVLDALQLCASLPAFNSATTLQVQLPSRLGGIGFRSTSTHAPAAYIASLCASRAVTPLIIRDVATFPAITGDTRLASCLSSSTLSSISPAALALAQARIDDPDLEKKARFQRTLSIAIDDALRATATPFDSARLNSCAGASALLGLPHPDDEPESLWLTAEEFSLHLTHRLGLRVALAPAPCSYCKGDHTADTFGVHSLSCIGNGVRTTLHHSLRDQILKMASLAGYAPRREPMIPNSSLRGDVLLRKGASWTLTDIAVVNASCRTHIKHTVVSTGNAAAHYAKKKHDHYDAACKAANWTLVPLVVETFGAWSPESLPLLRQLAKDMGARSGTVWHRRIPRAMRMLQLALARGVCRALHGNTPAATAQGKLAPAARPRNAHWAAPPAAADDTPIDTAPAAAEDAPVAQAV
jgi:hypothetical protein